MLFGQIQKRVQSHSNHTEDNDRHDDPVEFKEMCRHSEMYSTNSVKEAMLSGISCKKKKVYGYVCMNEQENRENEMPFRKRLERQIMLKMIKRLEWQRLITPGKC